MIARIWHGRTPDCKADDKKYLLELESHVDHFEVLLASETKNSYNGRYLPTLIKCMKGIKI